MEWRQVFQLLDLTYDLVVDSYRATKTVRSMHHPMADSFDLGQTANTLFLGATVFHPVEQQLRRVPMIPDRNLFLVTRLLVFQQREAGLLLADIIISTGHDASAQAGWLFRSLAAGFGGNDLKFEGIAS